MAGILVNGLSIAIVSNTKEFLTGC